MGEKKAINKTGKEGSLSVFLLEVASLLALG